MREVVLEPAGNGTGLRTARVSASFPSESERIPGMLSSKMKTQDFREIFVGKPISAMSAAKKVQCSSPRYVVLPLKFHPSVCWLKGEDGMGLRGWFGC